MFQLAHAQSFRMLLGKILEHRRTPLTTPSQQAAFFIYFLFFFTFLSTLRYALFFHSEEGKR